MPPSPETPSLALLIQKCTSLISLRKARQLHARILATIPMNHQGAYPHNNLLSMYVRCGSFVDAKHLFDKMPQRNIVSYNALISACSRESEGAYLVFSKLVIQMALEGIRPNGLTLTSLLQAASFVRDLLVGSTLHGKVVKFGFVGDVCVETSLLGMYSDCGDLVSANEVFDCMSNKDAVAWNSMILGNLKNEKIKEGLCLFSDMKHSGLSPTMFTYSMVLNACSKVGHYTYGQLIHAQVIVSNILSDLPLQNALIDMYCNCGYTGVAFDIFSRIEKPDLVSWNSMIAGLSESEDSESMNLFIQLKKRSLPRPDEYTFAAIISATSTLVASHYGKPLHAEVIKAGCQGSAFVGATLVAMYFKNGENESAREVFSSIIRKDLVLWTEMIMGHSRIADWENTLKLFLEMLQEGNKVDSFALSGALAACADFAMLKQGEMIHSLAIKSGYEIEISVCGSLIDMYAKNGHLQASCTIFALVSNPDLKCWNVMLGAYSHHGMAEEAWKVFEQMQKHKQPDQVTFLSLLSACSHGGFVERGKFLWEHMQQNGCKPGPKHYSCTVSLLSRAGLMEEAEKIINDAGFGEDQHELWRTLLSSCVSRRNLEKGVYAAEQVLKSNPKDSGTLVLLSNLYAATEKWKSVAEMRRNIRGLMLDKDPGLSWIEAKNILHVFSSGDQCHPQINKAKMELLSLQRNMKRLETDEFIWKIVAHLSN